MQAYANSNKCILNASSESCGLTKEKMQAYEIKSITAMKYRVKKALNTASDLRLIRSNANGNHFTEQDDDYKKYCSDKLNFIKLNEYELFPEPQIKTSKHGMLSYNLEKRKIINYSSLLDYTEENSINEKWLYISNNGYASIVFKSLHSMNFDIFNATFYNIENDYLYGVMFEKSRHDSFQVNAPYVSNSIFGIISIRNKIFFIEIGTINWREGEAYDYDYIGKSIYQMKGDEFSQIYDDPESPYIKRIKYLEYTKAASRYMRLYSIDSAPWFDWMKKMNYLNYFKTLIKEDVIPTHQCFWQIKQK